MADKEQIKTVPITRTVPLHKRANIWKWQGKDKAGNLIEFSPGLTWITMRGPDTKAELLQAIAIYLYNARSEHIRAGEDDPEFEVIPESITPLGRDDSEVGQWKPKGGAPLTLGVGLLPAMTPPDAESGDAAEQQA